MHKRCKTFCAVALAAVLAVGCSTAPASSGATEPANTSGAAEPAEGAAEPAEGAPEGSKVVCHLDCSGTEASGYGATEEEARADVGRYIEQNCRPEDGQYFIFCDPPQ